MNRALCNVCRKVVRADHTERDGKIYLVKHCPDHGETETLISSDAAIYHNKMTLEDSYKRQTCALNCLQCTHEQQPALVFLDITNRCNMNCPICINNTPSMGFLFEPPMEYFEKIFKHLSKIQPKPGIQLFGGEPTARKDLVEIIRLARRYGLRSRVVTNGLKLADEAYCKELLKTRARILIAWDGRNPRLYEDLRNMPKALELKEKALENIRKYGEKKTILMTMLAKNYNHDELHDMLAFCHERRDFVRGMYLMPLAHTWDKQEWGYEADRITTEDVENIVAQAFPNDPVEFIPAGFTGRIPAMIRALGIKNLPFRGAHPTCESTIMLVSDGKEYIPFPRMMKTRPIEAVRNLIAIEEELAPKLRQLDKGGFGKFLQAIRLKRTYEFLLGIRAMWKFLRQNVKADVLKGQGFLGKAGHLVAAVAELSVGKHESGVFERHMAVHSAFNIVILPFEDPYNIETRCLVRCPAAFAYVDPDRDEAGICPVCSWQLHKTEMMRRISERYGTAQKPGPKTALENKG